MIHAVPVHVYARDFTCLVHAIREGALAGAGARAGSVESNELTDDTDEAFAVWEQTDRDSAALMLVDGFR